MSIRLRWMLAVAAGVVVIFMFLPWVFPGRMPAAEVTRHRMAYDHFRILDYAHEHRELPPTLDALPRLGLKPEADHYFEDGWNRKLIYETDPSGIVTLTSLGEDGVPGGARDAGDIVCRFPTRNADGDWIPAERYEYETYKPSPP